MNKKLSTKEEKYLKRVTNQYVNSENSDIAELKRLDKLVKQPATIFAYIFGIIATLLLGFGMSIAMKVILADYMWFGIIIGSIGIILVSINYFLYCKILNSRKNKYGNQIVELSEKLLNENL